MTGSGGRPRWMALAAAATFTLLPAPPAGAFNKASFEKAPGTPKGKLGVLVISGAAGRNDHLATEIGYRPFGAGTSGVRGAPAGAYVEFFIAPGNGAREWRGSAEGTSACDLDGDAMLVCEVKKIWKIRFETGGGDDVIEISSSDRSPPITVLAGEGNDTVRGGLAAERIDGGPGNDFIQGDLPFLDYEMDARIVGGARDSIDGGPGDDKLAGGPADDDLDGGSGNDVIVGGLWSDLTGCKCVEPNGDPTEHYTRKVDQTGRDAIEGGPGNDQLHGYDGDDYLFPGADGGTADGGTGKDVAEFSGVGSVTAALDAAGNGTASAPTGNAAQLALAGLEQLFGSKGDDVLATAGIPVDGDSGDDTITGSDAAELLHGGAGNDSISAGAGNDIVVGDSGKDTLHGNLGNDVVFGGNGTSKDKQVDADKLHGDEGDDRMDGQLGSDELFGGPGADILKPGRERNAFGVYSADRLDGGDGFDAASYEAQYTVDVWLSLDGKRNDGPRSKHVKKGNDSLDLIEHLVGGAGNDTLTGSPLSDRLDGGFGDDRITGGGQIDVLWGKSGNDRIDARDGGYDAVDCGAGKDRLDRDSGDTDPDGCESLSFPSSGENTNPGGN